MTMSLNSTPMNSVLQVSIQYCWPPCFQAQTRPPHAFKMAHSRFHRQLQSFPMLGKNSASSLILLFMNVVIRYRFDSLNKFISNN